MEEQRKPTAEAGTRRPDEPELVDDTEFDEEESPLGFAAVRLPWLVGAGVFLLYLITLNRWLRTESVGPIMQATGWDWTPRLNGPLLMLLTVPFHWLPGGVAPLALNLLTAVLGAVAVVLLVRCVALLPFDRSREARQRERSEHALLSIPLAWVPPVFGGLTLAFTLSFWEHATAFTGEMLDLVLFAWIVHSLLSYRISERESTLYQAALVYGLAITNNYAMIAFFPAFLLALVWIRGFAFFQAGFLGRMFLFGVLGLLLYLFLPAVEAVAGETELGFGTLLRSSLAAQYQSLTSFPPYVIILLSFTTLLPVLLMGVRWPANLGDTSAAGLVVATFIIRLVHVVMLAGALSALLGAVWGPRALSLGRALLPLHFLAALAVGYYSGYLLLVFGRKPGRARHRREEGSPLINGLVVGATLLAAVGAPIWLLVKGAPHVLARNGEDLANYARLLIHPLPKEGAHLLADNRFDLLLAGAALHREGRAAGHVMVSSASLRYGVYHRQMARRYPEKWPALPEPLAEVSYLPKGAVSAWLADLAASNQVFYLHPSVGYFFEAVHLEPRGMAYRVRPLPDELADVMPLSETELKDNETYWDQLTQVLPPPEGEADPTLIERGYVARGCSRGLDFWAVRLQRTGHLEEAAKRFEQALAYAPDNVSARVGLEFNRELAAGPLAPLDLTKPIDHDEKSQGTLGQLLVRWGPFDHPLWTFRIGRAFVDLTHFRQALFELGRVHSLFPTNRVVDIVYRNAKVMAQLGLGQVDAALAGAQTLATEHHDSNLALETLTQVYLYQGDVTNALANVGRQLALNPDNERALLNQGALMIQARDFEGAVQAMNHLLTLAPKNQPARLNRAIALLQSGQLDAARQDYETLLKDMPDYYGIHYGLAEIARQQQRNSEALEHYRAYLQSARPGTTEYQEVQRRVKELGG